MCNILIIDDSEFDRRMIRNSIGVGCPDLLFEELPSGHGAVERIIEQKHELVVLDLRMPEIDGFSVLDSIRAHPKTKTQRVVMISGSDAEDDRKMAFQHGADDFHVKPESVADYMTLGRDLCHQNFPDYCD